MKILQEVVRGRWTSKEHKKFLKGMAVLGNKWQEIANYIGTRTPTQVRTHAQKYFLRRRRAESKESMEKTQEKYEDKIKVPYKIVRPVPMHTMATQTSEETQNEKVSIGIQYEPQIVPAYSVFSVYQIFVQQ